jgi:glycosyltransferase involved in cell wall biosynthesis
LFALVNQAFEAEFLFARRNPSIPNPNLNCSYGKAWFRLRGLALVALPFDDLRRLVSGISRADVFVSSFIWNSYTLFGLLLCKLLRRKIVVWEEMHMSLAAIRVRILDTIRRILWRYVDAFFVTGENQKAFLQQCGVHSEKIFVANEYPGYVYSELEPREIELPFGSKVRVVLYLGQLIEMKGVQYLIRAFRIVEKRHENVALVVVGNGPMHEYLKSLSSELGVRNIHFTGQIDDVHVKAYLLKRSSIVVVPSIVTKMTQEGGPMVITEALSAGRPVVCTDACPHSRFIRDGQNGYVVRQRNVSDLVERIGHLLDVDTPTEQQVLSTFQEMKTHEYQLEQFTNAFGHALGISLPSKDCASIE